MSWYDDVLIPALVTVIESDDVNINDQDEVIEWSETNLGDAEVTNWMRLSHEKEFQAAVKQALKVYQEKHMSKGCEVKAGAITLAAKPAALSALHKEVLYHTLFDLIGMDADTEQDMREVIKGKLLDIIRTGPRYEEIEETEEALKPLVDRALKIAKEVVALIHNRTKANE